MIYFKDLLIDARKKKNILKKDVADLFGWTPMYYGRYESGYLLPIDSNIDKFAEFINIDKKELKKIIEDTGRKAF